MTRSSLDVVESSASVPPAFSDGDGKRRPSLATVLADLIATDGVEELYQPGGPIGVMAIHGGLEEGTAAIARDVAAVTGASLYAVVQPKTLWWHVPSTRYDPADSVNLAGFIGTITSAFSLHGYGEPGLEGTALLGGNNRALAAKLAGHLTGRGVTVVDDLDAIPIRLRGIHRLNPVNLPPEAGVQIELPMELRHGDGMRLVTEALIATVRHETHR